MKYLQGEARRWLNQLMLPRELGFLLAVGRPFIQFLPLLLPRRKPEGARRREEEVRSSYYLFEGRPYQGPPPSGG